MRDGRRTYVGPEHDAGWRRASPAERRAESARATDWFRSSGGAGRSVGGEEHAAPRTARPVRRKGITDGPVIVTKEVLGGFIVVDVPDEATALEMAAAWPALDWATDAVEVRPVGDSEAEGRG
jgi:hypothetical protein